MSGEFADATTSRYAVVVGSEGGIGSVVKARLEADRYEVVGVDRSTGIDAADADALGELVGRLPRVDILVHLAGRVGRGSIEDHSMADWDRVLRDNLTTAFVACRAVIPRMRQQRSGAIVLASSVNGRHGGNRLSGVAYAVAKAGVIGLTRHLAMDAAADGVRVNAVAPGPVSTPMLGRLSDQELSELTAHIPLHRVSAPDEIAEAVAFLLSPAAASITGVVLDMNGGGWVG